MFALQQRSATESSAASHQRQKQVFVQENWSKQSSSRSGSWLSGFSVFVCVRVCVASGHTPGLLWSCFYFFISLYLLTFFLSKLIMTLYLSLHYHYLLLFYRIIFNQSINFDSEVACYVLLWIMNVRLLLVIFGTISGYKVPISSCEQHAEQCVGHRVFSESSIKGSLHKWCKILTKHLTQFLRVAISANAAASVPP